ncbi:phospholipid-transporting ATPase ABCA1-like isoform X2 [Antedon mediterranea]|uniref:phospholipid-transporting ATPase ABCA1-like isoform X2 n=1 Tax=Antedon mediterranea TaxID=105859 RepID=UPI003AF56C41
MSDIGELIMAYMGNNTTFQEWYYEFLRNVQIKDYISSLSIKYIPHLYGLEISIPTFEGILVNATETRKLIQVSFILPEVVDLILSLTNDQEKMMEFFSVPFPFMYLCETGTFNDYFTLSNMSKTDVELVQDTLCSINASLIKAELAELIDLDEIMHELSVLSNKSIEPQPFNLTEQIILQEHVNAVYATLAMYPPQIRVDEKWLETTLANLTAVTDLWLAEMEGNTMNYEMTLEQLSMMFANESWYKDLQKQIGLAVSINSALNDQLLKLVNGTIDLPKLESLFKDESEIRDFLELSDVLPEIVDVFLSLTISPSKFIELLAMEDPFTVLCEEGSFDETFMLPPDSTTDLGEVEEAICKINMTVLQYQLLDVFGITDALMQDKEADFQTHLATAMELSETIQTLIANPPKVEVDFEWLEKTLEELETVYDGWIESLFNQIDTVEDLENLQALLESLIESEDVESIRNISVVITQILAHLNGEIYDLPGQNLTFADIFPPATPEYLEVVLDQTSNIIGLQLGSEIDTQAFMEFLMNETDPLIAFCSDVTVLESFVTVVEGVNVTELHTALCSLDLPTLEAEWGNIFATYSQLLEPQSSFNLTASSIVVSQFITSVAALIENPPNLEMLNEEWIDSQLNDILEILNDLEDEWTGELNISTNLLKLLRNQRGMHLGDELSLIFHTTNAYIEFINQELEELIGTNKTFVELLITSLTDYLEAEGVEEDVIKAIENATYIPGMIIKAYIEDNLITSLCGDQEILFTLLQFEENVDVDRVQEMLCSVDLQAWLNSTNSLLDLWSMEFSKNIDVNATFDLVEFHANVEKLLGNIKAILENPPMFHVGIDPEDINFQSIFELLGNYSMEIKHLNLTDVLELLGEFSDEDFLEGMSPMLKHVTEILMLAITDPDELEQLVKETLMEMIESNEWTEQNITHAIIDNLLLIYKFAQIENSDKWKHIMCNQSTFIEMFDLTDSVDVSVLQMALCNLSTEVLFRNASAYYGFDVLESIHKIDGFLSVLFNESAIDFDAIQELLAIVELIKPIVSDGNLADLEETLHEIIALLNTPVNELNVTRLHDLLSSLSNSNVSELINGYIHTAMELQEMYSSGNISLTNIVDDVEQYFEDAGLQEQVQPYIEIYNLILESIIKQTEDRGKTLIGLFNTSVPIETLNEQMNVPIEELKTSILSQFISVYQLASIYNHGAWDDVFCNATTFDETFNILDVFDSTAIQQIMCRMNTTAFFIHASNAHNIDILQFTAQIDRIIYQTSPMTLLEDTEWSEVVERTQEAVELLSWLSMLYGSPDMGDYYEIMARLEALQQQQTAQHIEDLMQIIEDFLPYLNDFPWMMDMMNSSGNVMDMIGLPNFQNISSSMICDMVEMLPMNNTLYEMIHGMIVQMDVVMVVARHSILQLPEKMEEMEALLANTDATLELGTVLIDTWPGLMNSLPVVLMDTDQFNLMSYIYSNYDQFESVLCEEGLLKFVFGIDESVDLGYLVTTMCSLHKIRETEFVQEMYKMIDATTLIKDIEEVSTRPFNCSVFSSDIERFLYDAITVSGNLTSLLTDGEWILEEYLGDIFEFMAYLSQLSNDEVDGLTSIISLIEQFSGSSTDLLKIIIELFEDYEMPQDNSTEILVKLADILKNSTEFAEWLNETLNVSPEFIEQILEVFVDADVLSDLDEYDGDIYDLLCNESMFGDIFTFTDSSSDLMYSELCSEENHEIIEQIYKSIDILKLIREMKNETEHSSLLEDLANLFRLSLNISDENLEELFKIPTEVQNGISSVYELVEIISTGSEFSDIFKSVDKVLDDLSPIFGENELYQQVAAFIDALENLGFIRNLLGELPTFKFGNMFHDVDKVEEYLINELGLSEQSAEDLLQSFVILENILDLEYIDSLSSAFCDEDQIDMLLTFPPNTSMSDISEISETLCGLDPEVFLEFGEFLYKELDVAEIVIDIVTFSINDQIANATESVQKVNELVNQLQDALPALSSTMNISMLIPDDILEDLMGTVSAQMANEVLQVFVCGATVEDVENSPSRRRREAQHETHMKRRDAGSSAEMSGMKKIANVIKKTVNNGRHKRATQGDYISGAKTKYCDDLYRYINNNGNNGVIAWTYLKPILLGKIPYSPNSPAAQKIVKEASYLFDEIKGIRDFSAAWLVGSKELSTFNSDDYEDLLELLDNTFVQDLLVQQANIDAESLTSILENGVGLTTEEIEEINLLAEFIVNITDCIELDRFVGYDTEDDMVAAAESLYDSNDLFAAVRFLGIDDATEVPHHVAYKIRVEIDNTPSTEIVKDYLWRPGPNNNFHTDQQYQRVFIIVQDMLDRGIINLHAGDTAVQPTTYVQQMPYPCYQEDEFAYYITYAIPIFLTIAFIVIIAVMSYSQVYEKENGLEEAMMIMGLKSKINTISWFIVNFFLLTLLAISIAVILRYGEILSRSDVLVIFVFLECFLFSVIMLSYMVGSMCQRPNIASLVGALVYSISFLPVFILYLLESELELWMEIALCLLSPSAFCYGCEMLSRFEEQVVGASWSNFDTNPLEGAQLTFGVICAIMVADGLIYFIIGWYIKNVFPGTYGIGKPWYFPLTLSYWCGCSCEDDSTTRTKKYKKKKPIESEADMEPEPTHLPLGVSCVNLTKKYMRKKTLAVDNFSFNFYEGQVSVLLGHNGAGKTTLMSMLTGFYSSTSGDAYVGEYNIKKDAKIIRGDLGFCPQHDALYDNLTVKEHLRMYGILKGVSESRIEEETKLMLETLEMTDMLNQLAKNLSGGMKRKLCVAIAFFAGSKVVILDEPTSGVDPNARRAIWDLISQYKEGRTIILCTHFMDEADVLGDRIAFMDHGRLKCCGSPMFLKYKYGSGYKLTLVKETPSYASTPSTTRASSAVTPTNLSTFNNEPTSAEDSQPKVENEYIIEPALEDQQSTSASNRSSAALQSSGSNRDVCDTDAVTQFIGSYIEGAKLSEDISSELSYNLPIENGQAEKFETFFNVLDAELENLHVTSYGISNATLDEVFFKICGTRDEEKIKSPKLKKKKPAHEEEKPKDNWAFNHEYSDNSDISFRASNTTLTTPTKSTFVDVDDAIRITGILLVLHQFQAVLYKRFNSARRDIKAFFWSIIFPALLIAVALLIKDIRPTRTFPSLRLDPAMFESPSYLFFSNGDLDDPFVNSMTDSLVYKPGIGTSCMTDDIDTSEYPCIIGQPPELASETENKFTAQEQDRDAPPCSCSDGHSICPNGAGGATPPSWQTNTTTYLQDLSFKQDINEYLLRTSGDFVERRYIGVTFDDIKKTTNGMENVARAWYDNNGLHALPTSLNVLNNVILRASFPRSTAPTYGITAYNHPLKFTKSYVTVDALLEAGINYGISMLILCAFSMIPATFIMYLVSENLSGTKRLHYVSGMPRIVYILSNIFWDLLYYLVPVGITLLIVYLFDTKSFASTDNLPAFATLLVLYGWAVIPVMYITVRLFKDSGTAFITLFCANIFIALLTNLPLIIKELFPNSDHENIYEEINRYSLIFPQYCLAGGLTTLIYNQMEADMYTRFGIDTFLDPFSKDMLFWNYVSLAAQGMFFLIIAILVEYLFICNCNCGKRCMTDTSLTGEDEDVRLERERVMSGAANDAMVKVKNLKKVYRTGGNKIVAVDSLCVGIQKGECFGLLGVNGAGKTTTFKILTGDIEPTAGKVSINKKSRIGYCPQKDAVCDLTTGKEMLVCYGLIKGMSSKEIKKVVPVITRRLGMDNYINRQVNTYSGGMKRSLSTAISLIGNPNIVFLDEPTTGMDPGSRRKVWKMISSELKAGKSVVLTSHSMEECEALCTRLAIMVNGKFKCIGSPQHVKSRFGDNFTIIIRGTDEQAVRQITAYFIQHYPTAVLKECHLNLVQYELPMKSATLADIFGKLEHNKRALMIEDYSVTQTSLEQVFLNFASKQTDGIEEPSANVYDNFAVEAENV